MHPIVNIAIKAARRGGNVIVRHLDQLDRLTIESKGRGDFVSEVDRMAEREIIDVLKTAYPDFGILAEESGHTEGKGEDAEFQWIIDPLDGTTNFLHGNPQFAVSIALAKGAVLHHGVVFDPLRNEIFTATRGQGAKLDDRRIRVSQTRKLDASLIATDLPPKALDNLDNWVKVLKALMLKSSNIRRTGAAALDLAHVACGRLDGFWESSLSPWDIAAGALLIQEAGGLITDFKGNQGFMQSGNVVAGNKALFTEFLEIVRHRQQ
ncbi:MAG: inositol monophosphatase family protein [Arenicellales bacterium WSBS_2016_MAG_OTU3]